MIHLSKPSHPWRKDRGNGVLPEKVPKGAAKAVRAVLLGDSRAMVGRLAVWLLGFRLVGFRLVG